MVAFLLKENGRLLFLQSILNTKKPLNLHVILHVLKEGDSMGKKSVKDALGKMDKVSRILQVQELIDFFVLGEIWDQPRYVRDLDGIMVDRLNGVGVNLSYMSRRIVALEVMGHITRYWEDENRYNHYCKITEKGRVYFKLMLPGIYEKIDKGKAFYTSLSKYSQKFSTWKASE